ncbi:MAG: carboxynorspermidine decarboxylase [Elusimicrobiota bacterium]
MVLTTPYYLIDERKLLKNLKILRYIREQSGAKSVLALKCFATWGVFGLIKKYMDGTTSSSLYEARLGREKFDKEVHAYCVGFSQQDICEVVRYADKVIFNSISQLQLFHRDVRHLQVGLRVNPGVSHSHFDLADPARKHSRLGVVNAKDVRAVLPLLNGLMFHCNCENDDFESFSSMLDGIGRTYGQMLKKVSWVSLGGGLYVTKDGYPLEKFCRKLKEFSTTFGVQIYLEPGEAAITRSAELVTTVVDIVRNKVAIAIVDASTEAHMLDLLIYRIPAKIDRAGSGPHTYTVAGRSCLAGDVFGTYRFPSRLKVGSILRFADAAGYTMVKKNWFNGLQMPSIVIKRIDGRVETLRRFEYTDFVNSLS